jgi:hypothetical protein
LHWHGTGLISQLQELEQTKDVLRLWNSVAKQLVLEFEQVNELSTEQLQMQQQLEEVVEHSNCLIEDALDNVEAGLEETIRAKEFSSNWLKVFQSKDSTVKSLIQKRAATQLRKR